MTKYTVWFVQDNFCNIDVTCDCCALPELVETASVRTSPPIRDIRVAMDIAYSMERMANSVQNTFITQMSMN